jgi:hypothetical protein
MTQSQHANQKVTHFILKQTSGKVGTNGDSEEGYKWHEMKWKRIMYSVNFRATKLYLFMYHFTGYATANNIDAVLLQKLVLRFWSLLS